MEIETLGDAFTHSVGVKMWCAEGPQTKGMKRGRECHFSAKLDMMTLVATRGRAFPIAWLATRLKCPRCGSDRIRVLLDFPSETRPSAIALSEDVVKANDLSNRLLGNGRR